MYRYSAAQTIRSTSLANTPLLSALIQSQQQQSLRVRSKSLPPLQQTCMLRAHSSHLCHTVFITRYYQQAFYLICIKTAAHHPALTGCEPNPSAKRSLIYTLNDCLQQAVHLGQILPFTGSAHRGGGGGGGARQRRTRYCCFRPGNSNKFQEFQDLGCQAPRVPISNTSKQNAKPVVMLHNRPVDMQDCRYMPIQTIMKCSCTP